MQRFQSPLTLTLTAAALALATPAAHAQSKPYWVGEGTALRQAAERFERTLGVLETVEQNGGPIKIGDFMHLEKIVFPAEYGPKSWGPESQGPKSDGGLQETGDCGGIVDKARRRLRERIIELAEQPVPVRYEDVYKLKVVLLDAELDAALAGLSEASGVSQILPFTTSAAEGAFEKRVRFEVDPSNVRQAHDAKDIITEFAKTLEGDLQRMRNRRAAGMEETWLLVTEFRMNVERTRARRAIENGASSTPFIAHFAKLVRQRERLAKGVGNAN